MGDAGHGMEDGKADGPTTRKKRLKTAEKVAIIGGVFFCARRTGDRVVCARGLSYFASSLQYLASRPQPDCQRDPGDGYRHVGTDNANCYVYG